MKVLNRFRFRSILKVGVVFSALIIFAAQSSALPLVPEKVPPVIADKQDFQTPDNIHLSGWIGSRIEANEGNRLAKIDVDRLLEGYRKRPGRQTWDGEHIGKWLHAATLAWANSYDADLRKKLDYAVAELIKCQMEDGYLGTYTQDQRWTNWDLWAHKYNLIGLITYMRYTGNMTPLSTCRRMADLLCKTFGEKPGQRDINLAGNHMGMAPTSVLEPMVLLYRLTGETRYLDFCKYILRSWERPNGAKIISTLLTEKRVDKVGNGKAYEMLSCINGALEFYRTTGDARILKAALNAWKDIVEHRLYLTGTASYREFFHDDFDLPNVSNVGETCVTVTWLQFNAHLLRLTGEARFAEQLERTILNQLFGAQSCDGSAWGYYVQMQGKKPYSSTLDGHCCLSSGPRGVALIPTFVISTDSEGVVVNLYEEGNAKLNLHDNTEITVKTKTRYPSDEKILLTVSPEKTKTFAVKLRIPAWCKNASIKVNGQKISTEAESDGYVFAKREWKNDDRIELHFPLAPRVVVGDHKNEGRAAIEFGPLVLAADEALMENSNTKLRTIGISSTELGTLNLKAEPAPEKLKTWPSAQVFRINAVSRSSVLPGSETPMQIRLVPFADAGTTGSEYKIWLPYREPSADRNLLADGVEIRSRKPNPGSILDNNFETIASTFANKKSSEDWFGVELEEPVSIRRIIFAHGKNFHDGGWFNSSVEKPYVQIQSSPKGKWETICELKDYPATTATSAANLKDGQRFVCELGSATKVFGVRVVGKPSSGDNPKQAFSTCAELQAFQN